MAIASRPLETSLVPPPSDKRVPVILVATANEDAGARHLRSLEFERRDILAALDDAQRGGICEIVSLSDATPEQVMRTFQHDSYRDRIAVLHFAGHAGPEGLLFETSDGSTAVADAGGLAAFLGCQRGLQLVVLNACATQAHVDSLRDAGVGAVVATSRTVEDAIAHQFAVLFYQGLGSGAGIKRAYDEAVAGVRFKHGAVARGSTAESMHASATDAPTAVSTRAIVRKNAITTDDGRWPWDLYFRPGAEETVAPWALPEAAGNPLFGLPPLPETDTPLTEPFRHLRPFSRAHAELFFGRGKDIRALYDKVTSATSESVVLLYGATGVGKSSLLDAGLLPRLTSTHEVRYAPRDRNLGLIGTLAQTLGVDVPAGQEATSVVDGWRALEASCGRPLFVVIDQVEEAYTGEDAGRVPPGAGARELDAFAAAIGRLFSNPADRPRGRLVLGFRKEWLSEVKAALETHRVARTEHRLEQLTRSGVIEAITGPSRLPMRRMPTRLEIDSGLDVLIADDLLAKRASHVAPLLQILLATMWTDAPKSGDVVRFTAALYEAVQAKSKQLDKFLDEQLDALRAWNPSAVDSGLALDFLRFYTTPKATSDEHTVEDEVARYPNANEASPGLRAMCARLFLLVERLDDSGAPAPGKPARLAHDTLAPIVRERFDRSDLPGPRAKRVLDGRSAEWKDGKIGIPLDAQDLAVVEGGRSGMRAWTEEEIALIKASRIARDKARRRRTWVIRGAIAAVLMIAAFGVASWWLFRQSQTRLGESKSRELSARALAMNATRRDVALLYGVAAYEVSPTFEARRSLFTQLVRDPYLIRVTSVFVPDQFVFAPDGKRVFLPEDGDLHAIDIATGAQTLVRKIDSAAVEPATIDLDATGTVYSGVVANDKATATGTVGFWEIESGRQLGKVTLPVGEYGVLRWQVGPLNSDGKRVVATSDGLEAVLWDIESGKPTARLRGHTTQVMGIVFSGDGSVVATTSDDGRVITWDAATGRRIRIMMRQEGRAPEVALSRTGALLAAISDDTLSLWEVRTSKSPRRTFSSDFQRLAFTANDSALVASARGGTVTVFSKGEGDLIDLDVPSHFLDGAGDVVHSLVVSATGQRIAALSPEGTVHIWDLAQRGLERPGQLAPRLGGRLMSLTPDGRFAVELYDSVVVAWDIAVGRVMGRVPFRVVEDEESRNEPVAHIGASGRLIAAPSHGVDGRGPRDIIEVATGRVIRTVKASEYAVVVLDPVHARVAYGLPGTRSVVIEDLGPSGRVDTLQAGSEAMYADDSTTAPRVVFNPSGDVLAVQLDFMSVAVWDLTDYSLRDEIVVAMLDHLTVSEDGQTMSGTLSDVASFWRAGNPEPVAKLRWSSRAEAAALSPDGSLFAYVANGALGVVDVARGEILGEFQAPGYADAGLAFVDGGRTLLVADQSGRLSRISTRTDTWIARACAIANSEAAMGRWYEDAPPGSARPTRCESPSR